MLHLNEFTAKRWLLLFLDHLKGFPLTICLYKDHIYTINILPLAGDFKLSPSSQQPVTEYSENKILRIDPDYAVSQFAKLDNNEVIDTIKARDDQIFVLAHHRVQKVKYVHVFNMSGQRITSWQHPDSYRSFANGLIVTNELVIVADISNKRTTVYSRSRPGEVIKHIPSPEFSSGYRNGICEVCDDSFITLSGMNDILYKVYIATGKEESRHCIIWPRTVARVSDTKMLIVCSIDSSIHLVDMNKGKDSHFLCAFKPSNRYQEWLVHQMKEIFHHPISWFSCVSMDVLQLWDYAILVLCRLHKLNEYCVHFETTQLKTSRQLVLLWLGDTFYLLFA